MAHFKGPLLRLLSNDKGKQYKDGIIKMSDLNYSYSESIKNFLMDDTISPKKTSTKLNNTTIISVASDKDRCGDDTKEIEVLNDIDFKIFMRDLSLDKPLNNTSDSNNSHVIPIGDNQSLIVERRDNKQIVILDSRPNNRDEVNVIKLKITMSKAPNARRGILSVVNDVSKANDKVKDSNITGEVIEEEKIKKLINRSRNYQPIMGKNALLARMNSRRDRSDPEIIQELVVGRFPDFLTKTVRIRNFSLEESGSETPYDSLHTLDDSSQPSANNLDYQDFKNLEPHNTGSLKSGLNLDFLRSTDSNNVDSAHEGSEDFSDKVSYDEHKFLQEALGDELKTYISTDSQMVSDFECSEDNSIGTSNISTLLSRASTSYHGLYQDQTMKRSSTIYEEDRHSYTECWLAKKMSDLVAESSRQEMIIGQTSKALTICRRMKEFAASSEEVEAERILLIATLRKEALKEEIHKVEYEDVNPTSNTGSVRIRSITFSPKQVEQIQRRRKDFTNWFVCILRCGPNVSATKSKLPDSDGYVRFNEELAFDYLSPDFQIDVTLYQIKIKNSLRNYSHESKFHLNKGEQKTCPTPQKFFSLHKDRKYLKMPDAQMLAPSFVATGNCSLNINNLKGSGRFKLQDTLPNVPLESNFFMDVATSAVLNEMYSDFLNVGSEQNERKVWNRRWCLLRESKVYYFNSPEDEEPVDNLDLACCVSSYIGAVDRQICPRPRTLFLETRTNGKISRHFLTADSVQSLRIWEVKLNDTVAALRNWNSMKCNEN